MIFPLNNMQWFVEEILYQATNGGATMKGRLYQNDAKKRRNP